MVTDNSPAGSAELYHGASSWDADSTAGGDTLLASLKYPQDFCLRRIHSDGDTDCLLYTSRTTGKGLRVLLFGRVLSFDPFDAARARLTLATLSPTTDKGQLYFDNAISELGNIIAWGMDRHSILLRTWIVEDYDCGPCALIDMSEETKVLNGPLATGNSVVVDVTLHRLDRRRGDWSDKEFFIIANEVELIDSPLLMDAGLIPTNTREDELVLRAGAMKIDDTNQ
ncbi:hypothetical protein DFH06DRAFT_1327253 [Mycena polygramma]|nr:hypothetical protein DFH06DRAFT_1327253 [Mycena polygramma]